MDISVLQNFQIIGVVAAWTAQALADGRITLKEAVQLAKAIAQILGVQNEIDMPESLIAGEGDGSVSPENLEKETWVPEEPVVKPIEN